MKHIAVVLVLFGLAFKASSVAGVEAGAGGIGSSLSTRELAYRASSPSYNDDSSQDESYQAPKKAYRLNVDADNSYDDGDQYQSQGNKQSNYQNTDQKTNINNNINVNSNNKRKYSEESYDEDSYPKKSYEKPPVRESLRVYKERYVARNSDYDYDAPAPYLKHKDYDNYGYSRYSLIPMVGGSWFGSQWGNNISNRYTFGLALDIPFTEFLSGEVESGYGRYSISYSSAPALAWKHDFNQFILGGNLKVYFLRGWLRPYAGVGLMAVYYDSMSRGPYFPYQNYSTWVGEGQAFVGADFRIMDGISLGCRAAYLIPLFNRPATLDNGIVSAPGYEEAAAINTSFYKVMATVKVSL